MALSVDSSSPAYATRSITVLPEKPDSAPSPRADASPLKGDGFEGAQRDYSALGGAGYAGGPQRSGGQQVAGLAVVPEKELVCGHPRVKTGEVLHLEESGRFNKPEDAAQAALSKMNPLSKKSDLELGNFVCRDDATNKYFNSPTMVGGQEGVNPYASGQTMCPAGSTAVGMTHTHGAANPRYQSNEFSSEPDNASADTVTIDRENARLKEKGSGSEPFKGYLGTPQEGLKQYDPDTKKIEPMPTPPSSDDGDTSGCVS